jgi:arabinogalactan oligomer/maltooligosaccharide transport system permease protein
MHKTKLWQQIAAQATLAVVTVFVLLPVWGVVYLAFDGSVKGWPITFRLWPEQFSLAAFQHVWTQAYQSMPFLGLLRNSLLVAGGAALCSIGFGASMAYAFARYRFPGRAAGLFGLLVGAMLPPVALMTPLFILLSGLGIRATLLGLMIVYTSFSLPFCIWNMRSAFQAVPKELEESAFLDGATSLVSFWRITLPLALPSISVAAVIAFLIGYSEFAIGWLFIDKGDRVTLAMAISGFVRGAGVLSWSNLAVLSILMSVPVVVLFIFLQRYLLRGLLFGSVEG